MKVWVVEISDFLPIIDGNNRLYRAGMLSKAFAEKGHQVLWWTSTFNHQLRRQRFETSKTVSIQKNYKIRLLFGPGYKRSVSFARLNHNRTIAKEFLREATIMMQQKKPDIIYTCMPTLEVSEQAVHLGVENKIPVVVDIRELWPDNYLLYFPPLLRPIVKIFLKKEFARINRIMSRVAGIVASSEAYVKWGIKVARREARLSDKCFVLGSYAKAENDDIDLSDVTLSNLMKNASVNTDTMVVTYTGTFGHLYDFKTVMRVAKELDRAGEKRVQFLLVGDSGAHVSFLRKCSNKYDNVHMTGWVNGAMVKKILAMSSVGLAPYAQVVAAPTLPNKPFEYMAAEIPILSSIEGELKEIVERESIGLPYKTGNINSLKDKIMWFLSHPEGTKAMGQRAKVLFEEKYNADVVYPGLVDHLIKIASGRYQTNE